MLIMQPHETDMLCEKNNIIKDNFIFYANHV